MIDNQKQVTALIEKLKMHLPIPAKATEGLIATWRAQSLNVPANIRLEIVDVLYMGDEAGIACALKIPGHEETAYVVSLTHIRLFSSDPLSPSALAYQTVRIKKLEKRNRAKYKDV